MKESEDPESTRDLRTVSGWELEVRESVRESGVERVDALSDCSHTRVYNAILELYGVSGTAQSFLQV